jgi:predicted ATP-dependent endonuclease of OLD family
MKLINRIEITKFRSFGVNESMVCTDINIFSGGNDSGKSNVLKALNLFFNENSDYNVPYNSENDFNKWFRDNDIRGARDVKIKVFFNKGTYYDPKKGSHIGINDGFAVEKIYRDNGSIQTVFYYPNGKDEISDITSKKRADAIIREKIRYIYIPAIRDNNFRKKIQQDLLYVADTAKRKSISTMPLQQSFDVLEKSLKQRLSYLSDTVKQSMGLDIETSVTFSALLESLTFNTFGKIEIKKRGSKQAEKQAISIQSRGDGIQMQFLAFLLWFVAKEDKKHNYIWGYEEPEIAFEFKRQFSFADLFVNSFSKHSQLFVTTHSPAFAFYEDNSMLTKYRVSMVNSGKKRIVSKINKIQDYYEGLFKQQFDNIEKEENNKLENDIWGIEFQRLSKILGSSIDGITNLRHIDKSEFDQLKQVLVEIKDSNTKKISEISKLKGSLSETYSERIFIFEDKKGATIWKNWFKEAGINVEDIDFRSSKGCTVENIEISLVELKKIRPQYNPIIFRQLDLDGYLEEQKILIKQKRMNKYISLNKYLVEFLPVNEIENFSILNNLDDFKDEFLTNERFQILNMNFLKTAKTNIRACRSWDKDMFIEDKEYDMFENAKQNWRYFLPGKDICLQIIGYNAESKLKKMKYVNFPQELKDYLTQIKNHFYPIIL